MDTHPLDAIAGPAIVNVLPTKPVNVAGVVRRLRAIKDIATLKVRWHGITAAYQHHPEVQAARDEMKARLSRKPKQES